MAVKISWQRLFRFSQIGTLWLNQDEHKDKKSKLSYAVTCMLAQVQTHQTKIQQQLEDIRQSHFAADAEGLLIESSQRLTLRDGSQQTTYRVKKDELSIQTREERDAIAKDDLDIEPYFVTKLPRDLLEHELDAFTGIVITQETADKYRADMEAYLDDLDNEETLADVLNAIRQAGPVDYLAVKLIADPKMKSFLDALKDRLPVEKTNGASTPEELRGSITAPSGEIGGLKDEPAAS